MLLQIWTRDDETGLFDDEYRDGDVFRARPDSDEASLGNIEKKSWLFVKVPDPPNMAKFMDEIQRPAYAPGATPADDHVVVQKARFYVDWRSKFVQSEIAIIEDFNQTFADGPLDSGGEVLASVIQTGKFTVADVVRK